MTMDLYYIFYLWFRFRFVQEFTPLSDDARCPRKDRVTKRGEDNVVDIQYGVAFEPSYVYTMLQNNSSNGGFSVEGRQEDAEEFLSCLLNGINDEMLEVIIVIDSQIIGFCKSCID